MSNLQLFSFNSNNIRVLDIDGQVWFVAKDICNILEHSDVSMACKRLKDYEKLTQTLFVSGQNRDVLLISESGLYRLVLTSRKPQAEPFQDWVCQEVIPQIRKTGKYSVTEEKKIVPLPQDKQLEALSMLYDLNRQIPDDRTTITLKAHLTNLVEVSQQKQDAPQFFSVTEVLQMEGIDIPKGKDIVIGKKVAQSFREEMGKEPQTCNKVLGNGHIAKPKVYPPEFFDRIKTIAEEYQN
ncbi:UNVERIFIED_CONTAM: hypothetical protein BEN50_15830 [Euhalothece sp. KZN 001]